MAFDIATETFETLSSLPEIRAKAMCYIFDSEGKLLVAGGVGALWANTDTARIYDIQSRTWSNAKELPNTHSAPWMSTTIEGHDTIFALQVAISGIYHYYLEEDE